MITMLIFGHFLCQEFVLVAQTSIEMSRKSRSLVLQDAETVQAGWYSFEEETAPSVAEFWEQEAPNQFLQTADDYRLHSETTDDLGITHHRFQQYFQGYPVEGAEITLHSQSGKVVLVHGKWLKQLTPLSAVQVSQEVAITQAIAEIDADMYLWEDTAAVQAYAANPQEVANPHPQAELRIARKFVSQSSEQVDTVHRLCWYVSFQSLLPQASWAVYVDVETGTIFRSFSRDRRCGTIGTCNTLYNGTRNFTIEELTSSQYILNDCNRNLLVREGSFSVITEHNSQHWGNNHQAATSALWAAAQAWDYIYLNHNYRATRNDHTTYTEVHVETATEGAGYSPGKSKDVIKIGVRGSTGNSLATVDVLGHELMHGVDRYTADLEPTREPGAIGEGYSDIFGTLAERYVHQLYSTGWNWTIGEDAGPVYRNIQNPLSEGNPNVVWGGNYYNPSSGNCPTPNPNDFGNGGNDNCGVHRNSSITSLAFYLLAQGGSQNGGIVVPAIGIDKAANIAFRALRYYLQNQSGFVDARAAWIQSATDLYGTCSLEEFACRRTWAAVGVGSSPSTHCVQIQGPTTVCYYGYGSPSFTAKSIPGASHTWGIPSGWTVQYSGSGNQTAQVTNIASWASSHTTLSVSSSWNGSTAIDPHSVQVINCFGFRSAQSQPQEQLFYPQPAQEKLTFKITENEFPLAIQITDLMGRRLLQAEIAHPAQEFSLHHLASGLYLCRIQTKSGKAFLRHLQIKH
jgi:Zn-dependent metalloprotease